mmetsp:Transcript_46327/g.122292  ORF Transcript_46327/g.122292 Transcript_46327/m.122292 type:complete len:91 (+) Transcript_46327:64-336(+)
MSLMRASDATTTGRIDDVEVETRFMQFEHSEGTVTVKQLTMRAGDEEHTAAVVDFQPVQHEPGLQILDRTPQYERLATNDSEQRIGLALG